MIYPLKDKKDITQYFGERPEVYRQFGLKAHNGIDFRTKYLWQTPQGKRYCYAVMDGEVIEVGYQGNKGYGTFIRLRHEIDEQTVYAHLKRAYVKVGQLVKEGNIIGLTDNTGFSTGAHLHFGWRPPSCNYQNGYLGYEDPMILLTWIRIKCPRCEKLQFIDPVHK